MTEINGYLLTKEEEKACKELIKRMREKKIFEVDFTGSVRVKAKTYEEANEIFWNWVNDIHDLSASSSTIVQFYFENDGVEEE